MMDSVLAKQIAQLANDLATKGVFQLGNDLPLVGDALKRIVATLSSLDARITVLEKAHATPAPAVVGPLTSGSKVPPGAQA